MELTNENKVIDESIQGQATLVEAPENPNGKKLFLESYGCAMNFSDSENVRVRNNVFANV